MIRVGVPNEKEQIGIGNMDVLKIGERIAQRRNQLGLTMGDIANDIGVNKSTIQRYEKGTISKLKLPVIESIARRLNVTLDWLCCKSDEMISQTKAPLTLPNIEVNTETVLLRRKDVSPMIRYSKQAQKFLAKQEAAVRRRIEAAIQALPAGDVKKLRGQPYYRLRVGDFRILFDRDGSVLLVVKIDNRGQVYK
jgi:mRNA interferase RelE/StbE